MVIGERARRRTDGDRRLAHTVGSHTVALERGMSFGVATQAFSAHHYRQWRDRRAGGVCPQGDGQGGAARVAGAAARAGAPKVGRR